MENGDFLINYENLRNEENKPSEKNGSSACNFLKKLFNNYYFMSVLKTTFVFIICLKLSNKYRNFEYPKQICNMFGVSIK